MLKTLLYIAGRFGRLSVYVLAAFLFVASCSSPNNPCANVDCKNGGNCVDGTCNCVNGYTGSRCEIPPNPCQNVTCLNGGTCLDGTCHCINGYTGVHCEIAPIDGPCAGVSCQNGGTCVDGTCDCVNGYTGVHCEIPPANPCAGVTCQNGGTCVDGNCNCINGYTGVHCEIPPVTYTKCKITQIIVDNFSTGPNFEANDLYPRIEDNVANGAIYWNGRSIMRENVYPSTCPISFTVSPNVLIYDQNWSTNFRVTLWDADWTIFTEPDDLLNIIVFNINAARQNGYPTYMSVGDNNSGRVRLKVIWE